MPQFAIRGTKKFTLDSHPVAVFLTDDGREITPEAPNGRPTDSVRFAYTTTFPCTKDGAKAFVAAARDLDYPGRGFAKEAEAIVLSRQRVATGGKAANVGARR